MLALSESESNKSMPSLSCLRVHLASLPRTTLHVGGTARLAPPTLPHLATHSLSLCVQAKHMQTLEQAEKALADLQSRMQTRSLRLSGR